MIACIQHEGHEQTNDEKINTVSDNPHIHQLHKEENTHASLIWNKSHGNKTEQRKYFAHLL